MCIGFQEARNRRCWEESRRAHRGWSHGTVCDGWLSAPPVPPHFLGSHHWRSCLSGSQPPELSAPLREKRRYIFETHKLSNRAKATKCKCCTKWLPRQTVSSWFFPRLLLENIQHWLTLRCGIACLYWNHIRPILFLWGNSVCSYMGGCIQWCHPVIYSMLSSQICWWSI